MTETRKEREKGEKREERKGVSVGQENGDKRGRKKRKCKIRRRGVMDWRVWVAEKKESERGKARDREMERIRYF